MFQEDCFFQTAGAPMNVVKFGIRIIIIVLWPAYFLDLALCDFHIWGTANQTAANQNATIAELKGSLLSFPRTHECKLFFGCAQNCKGQLLASSCLSVCMEQLGTHWKDIHEFYIQAFFENIPRKFQVPLKSRKNNGYFT
jgi:hypothetical protein